METAMKRSTIYFPPEIHNVLKFKALETSYSISEIVNQAVKNALMEDIEDLESFNERAKERTISYEELLRQLKANGKI